jgi:hypothetical protein
MEGIHWPLRPHGLHAHARLRVLLLGAFVAILGWPVPVAAADPTPPAGDYPWTCEVSKSDAVAIANADQDLRGIYPSLNGVNLGLDLTWREDPFHDRTWQLREQSARFTLDLMQAWHVTGNLAYRDRALALLLDWVKDNPQSNPPSEFSWIDHGPALRATVLACAYHELGAKSALLPVVLAHGRLLADPSFYRGYSNHALDQSIGLFDIAVQVGRTDWRDLAVSRIGTLLAASVDSQGVTNEQSIGYEYYNWSRYSVARRRIVERGLPVPAVFSRIGRMPAFLAQATLPDGYYEMIGDTGHQAAVRIPGTPAEFAATKGAAGPKPPATVAFYGTGYLFARSGWGEHRAYADEVDLALHYGPRRIIHGHDDQGSLTLYGYGARLLLDPGKFSYNRDRWPVFFRSRAAHNVVTADGLTWSTSKGMSLVSHGVTSRAVDARLVGTGYSGVTWRRRVTYSRRLDWIVVDDRINTTTTRTFRQLWHLAPRSAPTASGSSVRTHTTRGNVVIRQLTGTATTRILTGRTSPIQGWQSDSDLHRVPAPAVEFAKRGRSVRYLTLIVPGAGSPRVTVSGVALLADGYRMTITIGGRSERVSVSGTPVSVVTP